MSISVALFDRALTIELLFNVRMTRNRIRQIREALGLSQEYLGGRLGRDKSYVSRLETGRTKLDTDTAFAVAEALGSTVEEILGIVNSRNGAGTGFSDSAVAYDPELDDPLRGLIGANRYLYTINSDCLDLAGIRRGDHVVVDDSSTAVAAVRPLQLVLVNAKGQRDPMKSVLLPRQFVPPSLAITNGHVNALPVLLGTEAFVFAVIVSVHRTV